MNEKSWELITIAQKNINRIKSPKALWIYKHPTFFGKVKQLNYFLKEKIENIYESAKE